MYTFDVKTAKIDAIDWVRNWFEVNGKGCNAIVGISGGVDSSVVAALCVEALGKDRVLGVLMPQGRQKDIEYSFKLCDHLGIDRVIVDVGSVVNFLKYEIDTAFDGGGMEVASLQNMPPRIRMTTLYAIAQSYNGRVIGTGNLAENYIGYFTKFGDGASDCEPIGLLTKTEVRAIGMDLGLPEELINKKPDDGLPHSQPDEEKLGFTYDVLDRYIREGICEDEQVKAKIDEMHEKNLFKLQPMPCYNPKNCISN